MRSFRRIAVYCGSSDAVDPRWRAVARTTGRLLADRGIGVVYGGGRVGLMGEVADGALERGGQVFGVIPQKLQGLEVGHSGCTELFVVDSMHARKAMMANLADGFVALPGGFGTLEEIVEVTTMAILNYHHKPVGLLNVDGFFDHLLAFVHHAGDLGFIRPQHRDILAVADDPEAMLEALAASQIPKVEDWIGRRPDQSP